MSVARVETARALTRASTPCDPYVAPVLLISATSTDAPRHGTPRLLRLRGGRWMGPDPADPRQERGRHPDRLVRMGTGSTVQGDRSPAHRSAGTAKSRDRARRALDRRPVDDLALDLHPPTTRGRRRDVVDRRLSGRDWTPHRRRTGAVDEGSRGRAACEDRLPELNSAGTPVA